MMLTRYAVEAKVGQEVENWIFAISKEATGADDHQMDADRYDVIMMTITSPSAKRPQVFMIITWMLIILMLVMLVLMLMTR